MCVQSLQLDTGAILATISAELLRGTLTPAGSDADPQVGAFVCVWVLWVAGFMGGGGGRFPQAVMWTHRWVRLCVFGFCGWLG